MRWWSLLAAPALCLAQARLVNSFESDADVAALRPRDARISLTPQGATEGARALRIEFQTVRWPALFFFQNAATDLREYGELVLDVTNPGAETVSFSVRVDDDPRADGVNFCRTGSGSLEPGATAAFFFPLRTQNAMEFGMRALPGWADARNLGSRGTATLDMSHIVAVQIFLSSPAAATTLIVDNLRLRQSPPLEGIVDAFGQWTGGDWPGKLHSIEEFTARLEEDWAEMPGRDRFGGWADGPRLPATGFFRAEKAEGKWWLVTPDGSLFFSSGVDTMRTTEATYVAGREAMFTWLPADGDSLARHFSYARGSTQGPITEGRAFNFLGANLERKYGSDYAARWADTAGRRLRSWGFNTVGNWSVAALYDLGIPYVATVSVGGNHNRVPVDSGPRTSIHDPYDSRFAVSLEAAIRPVAARAAGDQFCLGYFVDNELNWGGRDSDRARYAIALGALSQGAASPARAALIDRLRVRYGDVASLNRAWGTAFAAWEAVLPPPAFNPSVREDLGGFVLEFARRYFATVRDALRKHDPDHLYLGSRFSTYTEDSVAACAEFCDVLSFNIYQRTLDPARWSFLLEHDRPVIIGEFHFGALDRGMFHTGLVPAADQQERAALFSGYVRSVLDHPLFVGCHWFQYSDQAITGRTLDGENYNIGFVSVTDTPYPEMVEAARQAHGSMYPRRGFSGLRSEPFVR